MNSDIRFFSAFIKSASLFSSLLITFLLFDQEKMLQSFLLLLFYSNLISLLITNRIMFSFNESENTNIYLISYLVLYSSYMIVFQQTNIAALIIMFANIGVTITRKNSNLILSTLLNSQIILLYRYTLINSV